jgi:two-component system, sensor histidine kinase and response regulator
MAWNREDRVTNDLLVLDRAVALDRVGGDEDLLAEVAQLFLEDYPNSLREIEEAVSRGDAKLLERAAHTLKGAASNFGANPVVDSAFALEMAGRRGAMGAIAPDYSDLLSALREMDQDLRKLAVAA